MLLLAFDTCLDNTYVTLATEEKTLDSCIIANEGTTYHSAYLISTISKVLKKNNLMPKDIEQIAINIGPGSFTGIRACTTVARVMAQQLNIPTMGISSLEIISKLVETEKNILVLLDARKNMVYAYDKEVLGAIPIEKATEMIKSNDYFVVTDEKMFETFKEYTDNIVAYTTIEHNFGKIIADIAIQTPERAIEWEKLLPLYIQPPPVS